MKKLNNSILILIVFLAGCFTATVIQPLVVPPLNAQQANVQRWEYRCIDGDPWGALMAKDIVEPQNKTFARFGAQGWELAGMISDKPTVVCFKRPL